MHGRRFRARDWLDCRSSKSWGLKKSLLVMAEMTLLLTIVDLLRVDRSERLAGDDVPDLADGYACFGAISSRATPPISNAMPRKMMALSGWQSAGAPQEANPGSSGAPYCCPAPSPCVRGTGMMAWSSANRKSACRSRRPNGYSLKDISPYLSRPLASGKANRWLPQRPSGIIVS